MMFSRQLFTSLLCITLSATSALAAPHKNADAASTTSAADSTASTSTCTTANTVTVTAGSSSAVAASASTSASSSTSAATSAEAAASASSSSTSASVASVATSTATDIGDFGSCTVPQIEFATGFDNRKETSFQPVDQTSYNHGSAQGIDIITQFICDTLTNTCGADATAKATCATASQAADGQTAKTGAQADAFNAVFGIQTDFAAVAEVDDQGNVVSPGVSSTAAAAATEAVSSSSSAAATATASTSCSSGSSSTKSKSSKSKGSSTTTSSSASASVSVAGNVAASALDFGSCSTPQISFASGLDGRKETAFVPTDLTSFNHGSADGIDVITSFICGQLQSACKANQAAISTCSTASSAADAATVGSGAQADAFNAAFGIQTDFASVAVINDQGQTVSSGSVTSAAVAAAATTTTASSTTKSSGGSGSSTSSSTGAAAGSSSSLDDSLTLDSSVLATGFEQDGNETPTTGQVASLTSKNNFINFCAGQTITNGAQVKTGSCNPAPMGQIAATTAMPSCKFVFPANGDTSIKGNTTFTVQMAISNLETGNFVNAATNYFAAPQQVNSAGQIVGHSHIVIQQLDSLDQTTALDPNTFAFFKGLNDAATNGVLSADVTGGLSPGFYRLASINSAANHQPALVAVAQHGSLDDIVYFTVQ